MVVKLVRVSSGVPHVYMCLMRSLRYRVRPLEQPTCNAQVGNSEGHLDCCKECRSVNDCSYFTFDYTSKVCYLKSGKGTEKVLNGLVSGMAVVP